MSCKNDTTHHVGGPPPYYDMKTVAAPAKKCSKFYSAEAPGPPPFTALLGKINVLSCGAYCATAALKWALSRVGWMMGRLELKVTKIMVMKNILDSNAQQ